MLALSALVSRPDDYGHEPRDEEETRPGRRFIRLRAREEPWTLNAANSERAVPCRS